MNGNHRLVRSPRTRVGVAASSDFLEFDAGWPELRSAFLKAGVEPLTVVWDGDDVSHGELDIVVLNYCWGYVKRPDTFLAWAERIAAESLVVNSVTVVRWNSQKTYLADLANAGVPIVPTTFVAPGEPWRAPSEDYVVKPAVGSGGSWAARYAGSAPEEAERHVAFLHAAAQVALVQPYQRAVDVTGETAMIFFGQQYSHAVHKAALLTADVGTIESLWEREIITPTAPPEAHLEVANLAMATVADLIGETCYARVDVVDGNDGLPVVLEVELIEPSLFLHEAEGSASRFVGALIGMLRR